MHAALALVLLLASEPPKSLSPAAAEHNTKAMQHYDAGQYGPAADEFYAAYQTMPDARRDREGRELLIGSLRASLLTQQQVTGEVAPLCRLQKILKEHVDSLTAAFPEDPEMLEIRSIRARHEEVTAKLAAIGPDACSPPPVVAAPVVAEAPAPPPAPAGVTATPDSIPPRQLKIAGGVTLGLGGVLLAVMTYGIVHEANARTRAIEIRDRLPDCPLTPEEFTELQELRSSAFTGRHIAVGTGIAAGAAIALGGALLGLARRSPTKRWSAAPWWSPTGAGFNLLVHLGATRGPPG